MENTTVRINKKLLERVKKITQDEIKKIRYKDKRQFVDAAVLELLLKEEKE